MHIVKDVWAYCSEKACFDVFWTREENFDGFIDYGFMAFLFNFFQSLSENKVMSINSWHRFSLIVR